MTKNKSPTRVLCHTC